MCGDRGAEEVRDSMNRIVKRTLPVGTPSACIDGQTFGPWPHAIECKDCIGTGNFYGNDEDDDYLPCDECAGRGWNPPPARPNVLEYELTEEMQIIQK